MRNLNNLPFLHITYVIMKSYYIGIRDKINEIIHIHKLAETRLVLISVSLWPNHKHNVALRRDSFQEC